MSSNESILYPGLYYHIYNHGNANDNIFLNDDNYTYFLKRYTFFINPLIDTYAYCLMPNHFHFVVYVKTKEEICRYYSEKYSDGKTLANESASLFISQQFSNFFNGYSKAFNKMHNRSGKLFRLPFKRKLLDTDAYLQKAIHYLHANPVHHGFCKEHE
jgi:putative transposase